MIRLDVTRGESTGTMLEPTTDVVRIGRAEGNDLVVPDTHVSSEHATIVFAGERYVLVDQRSTNGTAILRNGERIALDDTLGRELPLEDSDVIELGSADRIVHLTVTLKDEGDDARVFALKKIEDLVPQATIVEKDDNRLRALYDAQKKIGSAPDLAEVLVAICESSFTLVPLATHVTIVLRDDEEEGAKPQGAAGYVPVMTRVRGQDAPSSSPIPITRSVFRKVVTERAAVVAADAPSEVGARAQRVAGRRERQAGEAPARRRGAPEEGEHLPQEQGAGAPRRQSRRGRSRDHRPERADEVAAPAAREGRQHARHGVGRRRE